MTSGLPRRLALGAAGVALGVLLGAPAAASVLAPFSWVPVPNPVLIAPVVGVLLYWWTDGIEEVLGGVILVAIAGLAVVVLTVSAPALVLNATAGQGAIYQTGFFNAIASMALAVPFVGLTAALASVLDTELGLLRQYHPRGVITPRLVAATVGLALLSALLAGSVGANYASVAAQSQVDVTVVGVDVGEETVAVDVRVPNRLRATMRVQSIVLDVRINGTEPLRATSLQRATVSRGENRTFEVTVDELSPAAYRDAESIRITGVVRFRAFRGYESSVPVEPWQRNS